MWRIFPRATLVVIFDDTNIAAGSDYFRSRRIRRKRKKDVIATTAFFNEISSAIGGGNRALSITQKSIK